jgi:hypothetical protein
MKGGKDDFQALCELAKNTKSENTIFRRRK